MGKTQSKRSVDITTDTKMVSKDSEFPDKMEKIDDAMEQNEVNGDTIMTDKLNQEEENPDIKNCKNLGGSENDDGTTCIIDSNHSDGKTVDVEAAGDDDSTPKDNATSSECAPKQNEVAAIGGGDNTTTTTTTTTTDGSLKKFKMEKVKKKWSFRSISFGKKDKQKPIKNEEVSENATVLAAATNGISDGKVTTPIKENEENDLTAKATDEINSANKAEEQPLKDQEQQEEEQQYKLTQSEVKMASNNNEHVLGDPREESSTVNHNEMENGNGNLLTPEENTNMMISNDNNLPLSENMEKNKVEHTPKEDEGKTITNIINGNGDESSTNNVQLNSKEECIENGRMDNKCENISNENIPAISAIEIKNDNVTVEEKCNENIMQKQLNGSMGGELDCEIISENFNVKQIKEENKEESNKVQVQVESTLRNQFDNEIITLDKNFKEEFESNKLFVDEREKENKSMLHGVTDKFLESAANKNDIKTTLNLLDTQVNIENQNKLTSEVVQLINKENNAIIALENECDHSNKKYNDISESNKEIKVEKIDRNSIENTNLLVSKDDDAKEKEIANNFQQIQNDEKIEEVELIKTVLEERIEIAENDKTSVSELENIQQIIDGNSSAISSIDCNGIFTSKAIEIATMTSAVNEEVQEQEPKAEAEIDNNSNNNKTEILVSKDDNAKEEESTKIEEMEAENEKTTITESENIEEKKDCIGIFTSGAMEIVTMTSAANEEGQQPNELSYCKGIQHIEDDHHINIINVEKISEILEENKNQDILHSDDLKDPNVMAFNNVTLDMETSNMDEKIISDNSIVAVAIAADNTTEQMH